MTIESQILDLLETRLKTILIAGGFNTSAGMRVYLNQEYAVNEQDRPLLILFPGKNKTTYEDVPFGQIGHLFEIGIEGVVNDDERGSESARLRADLSTLLWQDIPSFGAQARLSSDGVEIDSRVENAGDDGFIGYVHAGLTIYYRTATGGI